MFDLGLSKIVVIGVVGLIVLGPERLPKVARVAGTLFGRAQRYLRDVKDEVSREMSLDELKEMSRSVNQEVTSVQNDIKKTWHELKDEPVNDFNMDATYDRANTRVQAPNSLARRTGRAHWRVKTGRTPLWFKQQTHTRTRISSEAARMSKHRRYAAHLNKSKHSFFE